MLETVKDTVCWDVTAQSAGNVSAVLRNVLHQSSAFLLNIWKPACTVSCLIRHFTFQFIYNSKLLYIPFSYFVHLADVYITHQ